MNEDISYLSNLARTAVYKQNWAEVDRLAQEIIGIAANSAEGHFLKGLTQKAAKQPKNAIQSFSTALALNAKRYDAAIELAAQYSVSRRNAEAAKLLDQYAGLLDNSPRYSDMAGTLYTEIGLAEKALPLYEQANRLQPGIDLFQSNLAACSVYVGKITEAREIYEALLKQHPAHQRNHYHLARLEKAKDTKHISEMTDVLQSSNLPADKNIFLYYALGKEYEDLERWDDAFTYYKKAGDAVSSVAKYDLQNDIALVDLIIKRCNQDWLKGRPVNKQHKKTGTPVFIVGLPRTGTTLTDRIISSHSSVRSVGETQFLQMVLRRESGVQTLDPMNADIIEAACEVDIQKIADAYMEAIDYRLGDEAFFIDKLPLNFLFLGYAAKAFPDAKLIHLQRHPMDACFSMYKQVFTWAYKFSYTLENLGHYYIAYHRLLQHWRSLLGDRLVEVRYESLVADTEEQTRLLLDKLHLPFEEACLNFEKNKSASATASSVQIREKTHTRSVERWRKYGSHLAPLQNVLSRAGVLDDNGNVIDAASQA